MREAADWEKHWIFHHQVTQTDRMQQLRPGEWLKKPWWTAAAKRWPGTGEQYMILEFDERETRLLAACKQDLRTGAAVPFELFRYGQVAE